MKTWIIGIVGAVALALAACDTMTPEQEAALGAAAGAGAGLLLADAFDANSNWTVVAALSGAAAGTLVARNSASGNCAYARGDGTYYSAPC
ncbi:glucose-6-phosphate isomerase [Pseudooceanicola lipolyticus]|uniref:Glucose-6-phosphate isomerase n=1 Tax=Pseudooceanicola lipolyticus TaxID=2029104 RepID=A0A2M8J3E9_9RHOB|nr:glucose-6-phosphate isomerase [Pseudooceanicola lipolyticus]PJE37294.1 glucose-6-phosphate isomerase [Pseudooceanicola lipolyticus]